MTVYVVTHGSPVRYRIQGADEEDSLEELDDEKISTYKREEEVVKLFSDKTNVFELEVKFKNVFKKGQPWLRQTLSATEAKFDPLQHKIICLFKPVENIYMSFNHEARYSKTTLVLKTAGGERIPLEQVKTYIDMSADPEYNVSSQSLHLRAQLELIDDTMKRNLEGNQERPSARRKLNFDDDQAVAEPFPMAFPQPGAVSVQDRYMIEGKLKRGAIYRIAKAKFEIKTQQ